MKDASSDIGTHTIPSLSDGSEYGSPHDQSTDSGEEYAYLSAEDNSDEQDPRSNILSPTELEELFLKVAPDLSGKAILALPLGLGTQFDPKSSRMRAAGDQPK